MELWITPLFILGGFAVGVWFGSDIKKALASRKKRKALVITGVGKPEDSYREP